MANCHTDYQRPCSNTCVCVCVFVCHVQAGHPFRQRCAQSAHSNGKLRGEAPVFLLFLDCVWQILRQFPCSFQFSEGFLVLLWEHAYASQFGTFMGNCAADRSVPGASVLTKSAGSP